MPIILVPLVSLCLFLLDEDIHALKLSIGILTFIILEQFFLLDAKFMSKHIPVITLLSTIADNVIYQIWLMAMIDIYLSFGMSVISFLSTQTSVILI